MRPYLNLRITNSGGFALILLCFLMPFISIKCNDTTLVKFEGKDFVTGTGYTLNSPFGDGKSFFDKVDEFEKHGGSIENMEKNENRMEPNPLMIIILAAGLAGLVLSLLLTSYNSTAAIGCAATVLICLAIFVIKLQTEIGKQRAETDPMITDNIEIHAGYEIGFWLMAIAAVVITGYNIYYLSQRRKTADIGPII